jgi:wyosine [tRNA(Phe)-imidazoG37] synthetase (radical SAM superfamily)
MTKPEPGLDTRSGHVPLSLVYGPVNSRRFGRSLGVSFSAPGATVCRWRCPYCQLGDWPFDETRPWPPAATILADCARALAEHRERPLVLTVAGGGEPSDHPDFAPLSHDLRALAEREGVRLLLLTNADGLDHPARRAALDCYHDYQVKWDPGPHGGSWRPGDFTSADRIAHLRDLPRLRLQSMLYDDGRGGNHGKAQLAIFSAELDQLQPQAVHLGTIDRQPRLARYQPVERAVLEHFATDLHQATGVEIVVH